MPRPLFEEALEIVINVGGGETSVTHADTLNTYAAPIILSASLVGSPFTIINNADTLNRDPAPIDLSFVGAPFTIINNGAILTQPSTNAAREQSAIVENTATSTQNIRAGQFGA